MQKFIKFLLVIMLISLQSVLVRATELSTSISGNSTIEVNGEITLTFAFESEDELEKITAQLDFDSDLLEIIGSPAGLNGFNVSINTENEVIATSTEGKSGTVSFMSIRFKAKEMFTVDGTVNVSINSVEGVLFESQQSVSGSGTTKLITTVSPKSDNNFLSELTTNAGDIGFLRNIMEYSLVVENNVDRIRILAKAEDPNASVKEDSTFNLTVYKNVINIVVTAQNGSRRTYKINVIRKDVFGNVTLLSSNSALKLLEIEGYPLDFSPSVLEYRLEVENVVDNVLVIAEAADLKSSVIIDNVDLLMLGENRIQVTVVAENGQSRIYTIFVTRSLEAPQTKLQELGDIVYMTTATLIPVIIDGSTFLSAEVLDKVRRAAKMLEISKMDEQGMMLYRWSIDGRSVISGLSIDVGIQTVSYNKNEISALLDSTRFQSIRFNHEDELPIGTIVRVYIGGMFAHNTPLNLYRYDSDSKMLELNSQSVTVDEGYVEFEVLFGGEYIVSDVDIKDEHPMDIVLIGALVVIGLIVIALIGLLYGKNKNHKTSP
ncbi:MAG: hypothetical protein CVU85_06270 [Firmicutes bacterium HGW-Firmicutes-10]|nr:MAG: hypothetical protein CVU85_06270 [Firmicutes bacterium HGW-Firmicutes-10]